MIKVDNLFNLTKKSYEYLNAGKVYSQEELKAAKKFIKPQHSTINAQNYTSPYGLTGATARTIKAENANANTNVQYAVAHGVPAQQATKIFIA